jgi:RNA polymerase sigma-70 factor (ECF subfamily)
VDAFLAAARNGDFEALLEVLDPDVVFRADTGRPRDGEPIEGADNVARRILTRGAGLAGYARPAIVNGNAGVVVLPGKKPLAVVAFTVEQGRIAEIDLVANPAKLARLDLDLA